MSLLTVFVIVGLVLLRKWAKNRPSSRRPRGKRGAFAIVAVVVGLQALIGAPAFAQETTRCPGPPNPERPGSGMVGALDPAPIAATGQGHSPYDRYGYAGMVWHTYDTGCGIQGANHPNALVDTWAGNEIFNVSKNIVGITNGLHYTLLSNSFVVPLDDMISLGTVALYDNVFAPWFAVVALILAVILFRHIWSGDLASIGKRGMWGLAGVWFASATYLTPIVYTQALDGLLINGTSSIQAGFLRDVNVAQSNALPTVLHDQIVYQNWLRGEFGAPDSPQAKQLGDQLLYAQAWTKQEKKQGADAGSPDSKKREFEEVAGQMGSSYGYLQGIDGSRIGAGTLSLLQSLAFALFQLLAKAAILLAQVLLRMLVLAGPVIGLIAILHHQVLRAVGRLAGAAVLNALVIATMAGMHTLVLTWIFNPVHSFSPLTQILLAALVTAIFLMVGKPVRRMGQMVELSIGRSGGDKQRVPTNFLSRFRGRGGSDTERGSQDNFWSQVRDAEADSDAEEVSGQSKRRVRPEAEQPPVAVMAQRLDRHPGPNAIPGPTGAPSAQPQGGGQSRAALPAGSTEVQRAERTGAVPENRSSRIVDTAPVADVKWDQYDDDPVLIPSHTGETRVAEAPERPPPSRDTEVVRGRQVQVVYRPSRGLEVADD